MECTERDIDCDSTRWSLRSRVGASIYQYYLISPDGGREGTNNKELRERKATKICGTEWVLFYLGEFHWKDLNGELMAHGFQLEGAGSRLLTEMLGPTYRGGKHLMSTTPVQGAT